jgi:hypothetical protein
MRAVNVGLDVFYPSSPNYQPNAWQLLKALGVNTIIVTGGGQGDIAHFNMNNHPNEWAQNLNNFLTEANQTGVKVYFKEMGNQYGTLFNIVSPDGNPSHTYTPISTAKMMVGELAGYNSLNHNFITDPRIIGWVTANEPDIANSTILTWNLQLCDYIRSLGGKAWIAAPSDNGKQWNLIEPLLQGHVDYLEEHQYKESTFESNMTYSAFYASFRSSLYYGVVEYRGNYSMNQIILGEFGIWEGYGCDQICANFTDAERQVYYQAAFDAAKSVGIQNVGFFYFSQEEGSCPFGVIDADGNPYGVYTTIQNIYFPYHVTIGGSNTVPEFPLALPLAIVLMMAIVIFRRQKKQFLSRDKVG